MRYQAASNLDVTVDEGDCPSWVTDILKTNVDQSKMLDMQSRTMTEQSAKIDILLKALTANKPTVGTTSSVTNSATSLHATLASNISMLGAMGGLPAAPTPLAMPKLGNVYTNITLGGGDSTTAVQPNYPWNGTSVGNTRPPQPSNAGAPLTFSPLPVTSSIFVPPIVDPQCSANTRLAQLQCCAQEDGCCKTKKIFDLHKHGENKLRTLDQIMSASLDKVCKLIANGINPTSYVKHLRFLVDKNSVYNSSALISYDKALRDRAEHLGIKSFTYGDHELVHRFLGLESIRSTPLIKTRASSKPEKSAGKKGILAGYCWPHHEGKQCCFGDACRNKHTCPTCDDDHRLTVCKSNK